MIITYNELSGQQKTNNHGIIAAEQEMIGSDFTIEFESLTN